MRKERSKSFSGLDFFHDLADGIVLGLEQEDAGDDGAALPVDILDDAGTAELVGSSRPAYQYFIGDHDQDVAGKTDTTHRLLLQKL